MLFLADTEIILFLGDEEWAREPNVVGTFVQGVAFAAPTLAGEERVGIHFVSEGCARDGLLEVSMGL
jgi:hypothetical protein